MHIRQFDWTSRELEKMKPLQKVDYLVIHHTASQDIDAKEVDQWHKARGWVGIGYHYLIRADGRFEKGRPDSKMGAHALGHNHYSLGIAIAGNFVREQPTLAQLDALEDLLTALRKQHKGAKVVRHKDLCHTSCPGNAFPWEKLIARLEKPEVPEWKQNIINDAVNAGLINQDHNPDDKADKWFVLATELNLLRKVKEMIG